MLPIAELMDRVGFKEIATTGGNGFVVQVRNLREDPWERIRLLSKTLKRTPVRGSYHIWGIADFDMITSRDVIALWIKRSIANGIQSFWVCDYQTDMEKFVHFASIAKNEGARVIVTLCGYVDSPYHTTEYYAKKAGLLAEVKEYIDAIQVGDPCGILWPEKTREYIATVQRVCEGIPLEFHANCNTGLAPITYLEAIKAGVAVLNTAVAPLANGSSLPSTENILKNARQLGYTSDIDEEALAEVSEYFRKIAEKEGLPLGAPAEFDLFCFQHAIPGGMISNFVRQLREIKMERLLDKVLEEVGQVRKDLGYPVMATPYSQIVGAQALENVLSGERYKNILDATTKYILGYYGEYAGPIDGYLKDRVMNLERTKVLVNNWPPPEYLKPMEQIRQEIGQDLSDDELLLKILIPGQPLKRTDSKKETERPAGKPIVPVSIPQDFPTEFSVDVDGEVFTVKISPVGNDSGETETTIQADTAPVKAKKEVPAGAVLAGMAGLVLSFEVKIGDTVNAGDLVAMIEAMKMRRHLNAPHGGVVKEILTQVGEIVEPQDVLMVVA
jgi:pyruvate/oxaloacetate carboxyltransferase